MIGTFGGSESIQRSIAKGLITKPFNDSQFHTSKHFFNLSREWIVTTQTSIFCRICYDWLTVKLQQFENISRPRYIIFLLNPGITQLIANMHVKNSHWKIPKFVYFYPICKISPSSTCNSQITRLFWKFLRAVNYRGHKYVVHVFIFWDFLLTLQNGHFVLM